MIPDTNNPAAFALSGLPQATSETERNGSQLDNQGQTADMEDLLYDSVPPKSSITVSVRYRIRGPGQPLPYLFNEADGQ